MSTLRFVKWNVRGAGSTEKRLKIFTQLKELQADTVLVQETHLSQAAIDELTTAHFPHAFSCYNSGQRGAAILINRKVHFTVNSTNIDPAGRLIIVHLSIQDMKVCIVNIYSPNVDDPSFCLFFFTSLSDHMDNTVIIGGDFNLVLDSGMDRLSTTGSLRNWQSTNIVVQYTNDFGLCDAWHSHHPSLTEYTFFSPVHHSYSRLDYFLVSISLISNNPETEIHP